MAATTNRGHLQHLRALAITSIGSDAIVLACKRVDGDERDGGGRVHGTTAEEGSNGGVDVHNTLLALR